MHQNACRMNCANVLGRKISKKWFLLHLNWLKLKNYLYLFVMEDPVDSSIKYFVTLYSIDHSHYIFQKKEAIGDDDALPETITSNLLELTKESCEPLTVFQLKKVRSLIDEAMSKNNEVLDQKAKLRDDTLREMGNWLHPSVPVSNDEVIQFHSLIK